MVESRIEMTAKRPQAGVFRAIERGRQQVKQLLGKVARSMGMTEAEAHLLAHLAERPSTPIAELQRGFRLRPSTLTNILDRLEARRCTRREVNPDDHRSFLIELTAEGRRTASRIQELIRGFESSLSARVSRSDLEGFFTVLRALDQELE